MLLRKGKLQEEHNEIRNLSVTDIDDDIVVPMFLSISLIYFISLNPNNP